MIIKFFVHFVKLMNGCSFVFMSFFNYARNNAERVVEKPKATACGGSTAARNNTKKRAVTQKQPQKVLWLFVILQIVNQ